MADTHAAFAAWLRATRTEAGLSQQKVADALTMQGFGFMQTTVAKIERGARPVRLDEAVALTALFGVTVDVALGATPGLLGAIAAQQETARQVAARTSLLAQIREQIDAELGGGEPR